MKRENKIKLENRKCVPCERGGKPLEQKRIAEFLKDVRGWKLVEKPETAVSKIEKNFQFLDFKHALGFVNEIGDIAEYEGHHPDFNLHDWNKLTITLWTHSINGLSENDFIMAAKIDQALVDNDLAIEPKI